MMLDSCRRRRVASGVDVRTAGCVRLCLILALELGSGVQAVLLTHEHKALDDCPRIDARSLHRLRLFPYPVILTHVLDGGEPEQWANWTKSAVFKLYGDFIFDRTDLTFNGAGHFVSRMKWFNGSVTLAEILNADQPGNLFVPGTGPPGSGTSKTHNHLWEHLIPHIETMPPVLADLLKDMGNFKHASVGTKNQWNQIHAHEETIFTQIFGAKRWLLAPPSDPPSAEQNTQQWLCSQFDNPAIVEGGQQNSKYCTVGAGESIFFPSLWYHGTCDLEAWNIGFTFIGLKEDYEKGTLYGVDELMGRRVGPKEDYEMGTLYGADEQMGWRAGELVGKVVFSNGASAAHEHDA